MLQLVTPEDGQHEQDGQDEDDEDQEESAAVLLPDLTRRRLVLRRLTGLTVLWLRSPVVLESVVSHSVFLLSGPVIILGLLSRPLLLLLLFLSSNFTQLKLN